jgi:hypothetical protein
MSDPAWAAHRPLDAVLDASHELDLIRSAMALLAGGDARRITLVGLPLGDEALREVGTLIRASGLTMRAVRTDIGCDITVEANG